MAATAIFEETLESQSYRSSGDREKGARKVKSRLTLADIFSSEELKEENFTRPRWWSEGASYTTLRRPEGKRSDEGEGGAAKAREIHWHDAATGESRCVVTTARLTPQGADAPLTIDGYSFSEDRTKLLILTNAKKVWRLKTRGDYWGLDLKGGSLRRLGGAEAGAASLMFATFSPDGARVAFVRENNLYVQDFATLEVTALTSDGSDTVINGTFDWVYEEELRLRNGFRWSPDGQSIAYWQIDQSEVPVVHLINNTDGLYPSVTSIPYPKAGQTNPSARVGVIPVGGGATLWIDVPGDPREHYIAGLDWIEA